MYYHRTTFLQLNTIRFILTFPHPFIPSELSGSRRNESVYMSAFLFEDILPIIRCNSMQKVLDWPFCNLWQRAKPPNSKSDGKYSPKNNQLDKDVCGVIAAAIPIRIAAAISTRIATAISKQQCRPDWDSNCCCATMDTNALCMGSQAL